MEFTFFISLFFEKRVEFYWSSLFTAKIFIFADKEPFKWFSKYVKRKNPRERTQVENYGSTKKSKLRLRVDLKNDNNVHFLPVSQISSELLLTGTSKKQIICPLEHHTSQNKLVNNPLEYRSKKWFFPTQ